MSKKYNTVAVIVPTRNERETIASLIEQIESILPGVTICVVDDDSPDKTAALVHKKFPTVMVVKRINERGRGSAVMAGMHALLTKKQLQFFIEMDADGSHTPEELPQLLAAANEKTVALASRYVPGSVIVNWPLRRRISSRLANAYISFMLHLGLQDNTNGYRVYSRTAAETLCNHAFTTSGYIVLSESALVLKRAGFTLRELPSRFVNRTRGTSNATSREFISAFKGVWQIRNNA